MGANYQRALTWPAITLTITLVVFWAETYFVDGLGAIVTLPVLAAWLTIFGLWAGWGTVKSGGGYWDALAVGVILWVLCGIIDIVLFAYASGFGFAAVFPQAVGGSSIIAFGALLGGGWAATKTATT